MLIALATLFEDHGKIADFLLVLDKPKHFLLLLHYLLPEHLLPGRPVVEVPPSTAVSRAQPGLRGRALQPSSHLLSEYL